VIIELPRLDVILASSVTKHAVVIRIAEMVFMIWGKSAILRQTQLDANPMNIVTRNVDANRCAVTVRRNRTRNVITTECQPQVVLLGLPAPKLASVSQIRLQLLHPRQRLRPQQDRRKCLLDHQRKLGSTQLRQLLRPRQGQRHLQRKDRLKCPPNLRLQGQRHLQRKVRLGFLLNRLLRRLHDYQLLVQRHRPLRRRQGFRRLVRQHRPPRRRQGSRRRDQRHRQREDVLIPLFLPSTPQMNPRKYGLSLLPRNTLPTRQLKAVLQGRVVMKAVAQVKEAVIPVAVQERVVKAVALVKEAVIPVGLQGRAVKAVPLVVVPKAPKEAVDLVALQERVVKAAPPVVVPKAPKEAVDPVALQEREVMKADKVGKDSQE